MNLLQCGSIKITRFCSRAASHSSHCVESLVRVDHYWWPGLGTCHNSWNCAARAKPLASERPQPNLDSPLCSQAFKRLWPESSLSTRTWVLRQGDSDAQWRFGRYGRMLDQSGTCIPTPPVAVHTSPDRVDHLWI
jgi:hypothetical protein